jgi:DNA-binding transcriptional ArsR family regulator
MEQLTADEIFDVLAHQQRRHILTTLLDCSEEMTVSELAEVTGSKTGDDAERIEVGLYHSHLPRLDGMGIVEYDRDAETVEPTPAVTELEPFFELVNER